MSHHEEPALANGADKKAEIAPAAAPNRSVASPARVTPKPVGRWGVMAWVWELRDQGPQGAQDLCEREGELLLEDRVVDLNATTLAVGL